MSRTDLRASALPRALLPSFTFAVALALLSSGLPAQDVQLPTYDVELVIFQRLSAQGTSEHGPKSGLEGAPDARLRTDEPDMSDPEPSIPDASSQTSTPAATASFPPVPPARLKLTAVADTLRRSRDYRPLAHLSWTQPGLARNAARYVAIDELVPAASGLSGKIAVTRGRYLHLTLDLRFAPPGGAAGPYVLHQTRRMRSNERHYIDHPNFGVIAVITPTP